MSTKKTALTFQDLQDGEFLETVNDAIKKANTAVGASDDSKAKAEITIKITVENGDSEGYFRRVTPTLALKTPASPKRPTIYPVHTINGERVIAVDPTQDGEQMKMPGVTPIRNAS
ncbi:MAG: hypothetical protein PHS14_16390 [Elusimicrobia bacterium]|nr:hypothetical protein [Elusimicrobiota bacterium]